ncbi:hypothetical protein C8P68_102663 [Mucilaginibacter yixingensis]|uniref:Lysylphosphatidylglycerol synthase-like protein n=1 Tax=Mucilaginibacter yixingensis TaxID=1295612 RepID=A0A2T5JDK1_9SPHI|nr:lysylphosphatidylglycerol synthase domain-containing protein [Mucilaginibacter yixingensis]PTQ99833.1 hypothetical protein C8P68_102663 [Mucilaginibacter yixingensis]
MNPTVKRVVSYTLKAAIIVLAFTFIYRRLNNNANLNNFQHLVSQISRGRAVLVMSAVLGLMLANWLLEAAKWRYLAQRLSHITFWGSIEAVFCGLTWAIFTPNRIGEYGGRVMFLPQRKRVHGMFAMAVGSFGQNVVTNVLGSIAILWFVANYLHVGVWVYAGILVLALALMSVMILFFFNIKWMVSFLNSIRFLRKYHRFFDIMGRYKFTELMRVMGFCLARFAVFSSQYYLLIHMFIPELPLYEILLLIFVMFFIQSALPSLDLFDFGVRAYTADALFGYVTDQKIAIIASVTAVWFINLILPAILGSVFVLKLRFFDNNV